MYPKQPGALFFIAYVLIWSSVFVFDVFLGEPVPWSIIDSLYPGIFFPGNFPWLPPKTAGIKGPFLRGCIPTIPFITMASFLMGCGSLVGQGGPLRFT